MLFGNVTSFTVGFATGFGVGLFTREWTRIGTLSVRPIAKAALKTGMAAIEKGRETFSIAGETFEDLVAEARAELKARRTAEAEAVAQVEAASAAETKAAAKAAKKGHE